MSSLSFSARTYSQTEARLCGSSPIVGSSRNSTRGECSRPRAISSRRFMPPENVSTTLPRRSERPTSSSRSSMRRSSWALGTP